MKAVLFSSNVSLNENISVKLMIEDDDDLDIISRVTIADFEQAIEDEEPDMVVVQGQFLKSLDLNEDDYKVRTFAKDIAEFKEMSKSNLPSFGVIGDASAMITAIKEDRIVKIIEKDKDENEPAEKKSMEVPEPEKTDDEELVPEYDEDEFAIEEPADEKEAETESTDNEAAKPVEAEGKFCPNCGNKLMPDAKFCTKCGTRIGADTVKPAEPVKEEAGESNAADKTDKAVPIKEKQSGHVKKAEAPADKNAQEPVKMMSIRERMAASRAEEEKRRKEEEERKKKEEEERQKLEVEKELGNIKDPAKTVAVYSAKGGVGKTTISAELATYLALTAYGRGTYKVCIVDYNIDFGDVMNTLGFNPNHVSMSQWASDIRELMKELDENGEEYKLDDIQYTEKEIEKYLQKDQRSGLYALIAPITHSDSFEIKDTELYIMLHNIIHNGGFDFVICDTGNNTRDSSSIAIENADEILLVLTQDVNTANCNDSLLNALYELGNYDMNKFKLIINKAQNTKSVGVAVNDLKSTIKNPATEQPYETICVLLNDDAVQIANNTSTPLVYNPNSKYTSGIGKIAAYLIGDTFSIKEPEKLSLLQRLFGRK